MTALQIDNLLLFFIKVLIILLILTVGDLILLIIWFLLVEKLAKPNGDQITIPPIKREAAKPGINKKQLIKTIVNDKEIELLVSKQLLKWGFKSRINYRIMIKYLVWKAWEAQEQEKG